jgi:[protein-PII] uridylyltransferase
MTGNGAAAEAAAQLRSARTDLLVRPQLVGRALRDALIDVADGWLRERLGGATDVALVAVGGYGRREPAPGSDLDLLLLHQPGIAVGSLADALWYPIWDAGVGLDHSVRTVTEAVTVARGDLKVAMGLLDARHVAGDPELTQQLRERALAEWRRDAGRRLPELVESVRSRAQRVGELAFLLEPDLKEARGGLRDVVAVRAIAAAWVADAPDERVQQANSWLLDVRGELHRGSGRGSDRLVAQEQARVAEALGAKDSDDLMRQVYDAGRAIAYALDDSCRRAEVASRPVRRRSRRAALVRRPLADGVVEQAGEVHLARDADPVRDPVLLPR